jgi:hypothetical protein
LGKTPTPINKHQFLAGAASHQLGFPMLEVFNDILKSGLIVEYLRLDIVKEVALINLCAALVS